MGSKGAETRPETDGIFSLPDLRAVVSESTDGSGAAAMVAALNVPRNAKLGFGLAVVLTAAIVALFVVVPGTARPAYLYAGLAFVLVASLGGLLTAIFTVGSAIRLARSTR